MLILAEVSFKMIWRRETNVIIHLGLFWFLIFRSHYKRNKYKLLEKRSCVSVWVCFAPTMPDVGSRYSKFGFEKKKRKEKKNCYSRIPGFHLSDKKKVYERWLRGRGGGGGGGVHSDFSMVSVCLPFWKPVRLDWNWGIIHECWRTYRNNAILSFYFINCQSEQFDFYPFNTNDHSYPYLNSIYKRKYLDSM